ncbi:MAG: sel1 repeat family protein [Thiotrichaceae bacterium]|nr:sel1 repeat family protein [Thiotrichaceae bacterium]
MNKRLIKLTHRLLILSGIIFLAGCNTLQTQPSAIENQSPTQSHIFPFYKEALKMGLTEFDRKNYGKTIDILLPLAELGNLTAQLNLAAAYELHTPADDHEAVKWYMKTAKKGNPDAFNALGLMYESGRGVIKNNDEAIEWFQLGAEQGDSEALFNLGRHYQQRPGAEQDYATAIQWYMKAASSGHPLATHQLATFYAHGVGGLEVNQKLALDLYHAAAALNVPESHYEIGVYYKTGLAVIKNQSTAAKWFQSGAELGSASAQAALGDLYWQKEALKMGLTELDRRNYGTTIDILLPLAELGNLTAQLKLAAAYELHTPADDHEALKWYMKTAKKDNVDAFNALGLMYESGRGVIKNNDEAIEWFQLGAEQGDSEALFNLGRHYQQRPAAEQDYATAIQWYMKAAASGHPLATHQLATFYAQGIGGLEVNQALALELYHTAAALNAPESHYEIGVYYNTGVAVIKNQSTAAKWFQSGAMLGSANAQVALGDLYWQGEGVLRNSDQAMRWYVSSAEQGHKVGQQKLANAYQQLDTQYDLANAVPWENKLAEQ